MVLAGRVHPRVENMSHLGVDGSPIPEAYYVRTAAPREVRQPGGEPRFVSAFASTLHSQGAWQESEQHMSPAGGLLMHEIEGNHPRPDVLTSRVSFEILGVIHGGEFTVTTTVTRPGRTIELVEATMTHGDRVAIRASVWRLLVGDTTEVEGHWFPPIEGPEAGTRRTMGELWPGGYIESLQAREIRPHEPGRTTMWIRSDLPLVEGEPEAGPTSVAASVGVMDTANGIATRVNPQEWLFPNVDLSIHLFRIPVPGWVGFDTRVAFGPAGQGLTTTVVHDVQGAIGTISQSLTVRPMPTERRS